MLLFITDEQASELAFLLDQVLRDLTYEMAATEDSGWRADLSQRRQTVHDVVDALAAAVEADADVRALGGVRRGTRDAPGASPWTA